MSYKWWPPSTIIRPDSDVSKTGSTDQDGGTDDLWDTVNEVTADDSDYIIKPFNQELELGLEDANDPGVDTGHVIRIRWRFQSGIPNDFQVRLMDGATVIQTSTVAGTTTFGTDEVNISPTNATNITDYTDLRVNVQNVALSVANVEVSWIEMELP